MVCNWMCWDELCNVFIQGFVGGGYYIVFGIVGIGDDGLGFQMWFDGSEDGFGLCYGCGYQDQIGIGNGGGCIGGDGIDDVQLVCVFQVGW